jgi:hypothetical protein
MKMANEASWREKAANEMAQWLSKPRKFNIMTGIEKSEK